MLLLVLLILFFFFLFGFWHFCVAKKILSNENIIYINRFVGRKLHSPQLIATDTARFYQVMGATLITTSLFFFYASMYIDIPLKGLSSFYMFLSLIILIWKKVIISRYFDRGGKADFDPAKVQDGKKRIELEIINTLESGRILKAALLKNNPEESIARIEGSLSLHHSTIELKILTHAKSGQELEFFQKFTTVSELTYYLENSTSLRLGDFK